MSADRPIRYGSELPRIFTPPLRELTPDTSLGFEFLDFVDAIGVELFPWQRWFAIHALELLPNGRPRFRTLVLLVARQNGKTTILKLLALYWMAVLGQPLVIGTAQNLDIAEETWAATVDLAEQVPELAYQIEAVDRGAGKKALKLKTGERYKVASTKGRGGGRGLTGDLVQMDELREHTNWQAWSAVSNTTMARGSALVIAASNAGDLSSVVLRSLRFTCMSDPRTVGVEPAEVASFGILPGNDADEPDEIESDSIGIFEWSAHPKRGIWDRDGWAEGNPSLGYTITDAAMAGNARIAKAGGDAEWGYRTENLCQWRPTAGGGPFPDGAWEAGTDDRSEIAPDSRLCACVDTADGREVTHVAVAGYRPDGNVHVEIIATRVGLEWALPWLSDPERPVWAATTLQANGAPVSSLLDALEASTLPDVKWGGADLPKACGMLYDLVRLPTDEDAGKLRVYHLPQPVLDVPAATAVTKPLGDGGWVFDRKRSPQDCAPMMAAAGAVWLLLNLPPEIGPSAYESHDLMIV